MHRQNSAKFIPGRERKGRACAEGQIRARIDASLDEPCVPKDPRRSRPCLAFTHIVNLTPAGSHTIVSFFALPSKRRTSLSKSSWLLSESAAAPLPLFERLLFVCCSSWRFVLLVCFRLPLFTVTHLCLWPHAAADERRDLTARDSNFAEPNLGTARQRIDAYTF